MKIAHPIFKNKIESCSEKLDVGTSIVPIESDSTRIFFDTNLQSISYILDFCVPNNPIDQYTQRVQKS